MENGEPSNDSQNVLSDNRMSEIVSPTNGCIILHSDNDDDEQSSLHRQEFLKDKVGTKAIPPYVPFCKRFLCGVSGCLFKGSSCGQLLRHVKDAHKDVNSLCCLYCSKPTDIPLAEFNEHLQMHSNYLVICHYCRYAHYNLYEVVKHCRVSHPELNINWDILRVKNRYPVGALASRHNKGSEPCDDTDEVICVTDDEIEVVSDNDVEIIDEDKSLQNKDNRLDGDVEVVYSKSADSNCSLVERIGGGNNVLEADGGRNCGIEESVRQDVGSISTNPDKATSVSISAVSNCSFMEEIKGGNDQLGTNGSSNHDVVGKESENVSSGSTSSEILTSVCEVPKNTVTYSTVQRAQETDDEYTSDQRIYVSDRINHLLKKYGKTCHPEGNMFCCPKCNKCRTTEEGEMVDHLYKEVKYYQYVCTYCKRMALNPEKIQDHHLRTHAKNGKFASFARLKPDAEVEQWVEYVISTQLGVMETLENCNEESVVESMSGHLCADEGNGEEFQCKECKERFVSGPSLSAHMKSFHFQLESWICGFCSFVSRCRVDMLEHINKNHQNVQQSCFQHCMPATAVTLDDKFWKEYFGNKDSSFASSSSEVVKEGNENDTSETLDMLKVEKLRSKRGEKTSVESLATLDEKISKNKTLSLREILKEYLSKLDSKGVREDEKDKTVDVPCISESDSNTREKYAEKNCDMSYLSTKFIFTCFYCPSLSSNLPAARKHWEIAHRINHTGRSGDEGEFPFKFEKWKENDYIFRLYVAGIILSYYCSYCMLKNSDLALMVKHISSSHEGCKIKMVFVRTKVYFCVLCLSLMSSLSDLMDHFKENHSVNRIFFEVHCDVVNDFQLMRLEKLHFLNKLLKRNPESHDQNISTVSNYGQEMKFVCHWCKKRFNERFSLIIHHIGYHWHLVPKHKKESVNCIGSNYFEIHFMPCDIPFLVIDKSAYSCPFCHKKTVSFEDLFYHLFQHVLCFKCYICGYTAGSGIEVHKHSMASHPSAAPVIIHMHMLDDVMSRLLPQVEGVSSVDVLDDSPSHCRNKASSDKNEAEAEYNNFEIINSEKSSFKPIASYRYSLRSNVKETSDFSNITVWCDLNGIKGRKMTFSELSELVNINPYVCMEDCRKSLYSNFCKVYPSNM